MTRTIAMERPRQQGIDLMLGWPNASLLPTKKVSVASHNVLSDKPLAELALQYAPDDGWMSLRSNIAQCLTSFYQPKDAISPHRICISGGASQNLACLTQTFTDPSYTRAILMVSPTYHLACRIFEDGGFGGRLVAVPEDDGGIDIEFMSRRLDQLESQAVADGKTTPKLKPQRSWRKIYKYFIYCVPTFANPSGRIMSRKRRQDLVRLARKYDALVVTDDVYDMLQWPADEATSDYDTSTAYLPRIVDVDRYLDGGPIDKYGNAVSNGSFSKLIGPGCRTGWAEGTEQLAFGLSQTGSSRSGGCPSQLVATFIDQMISTGAFDQHLKKDLRPAYARRYRIMSEAIDKHLRPLGVTTLQTNKDVAGGYFIWLQLPGTMKGAAIAEIAAREEQLTLIEGAKFQVWGDESKENKAFDQALRLSFAWEDEDLLAEGVQRIARIVERAMEK